MLDSSCLAIRADLILLSSSLHDFLILVLHLNSLASSIIETDNSPIPTRMSLVSYGLSQNARPWKRHALCITILRYYLLSHPLFFIFSFFSFSFSQSRSVLHYKDQRRKLLLVISITSANVRLFFFSFFFISFFSMKLSVILTTASVHTFRSRRN